MSDNGQMICVREKKTIYLHWFNALCWLLLLASGFGIISGDFVRQIGRASCRERV